MEERRAGGAGRAWPAAVCGGLGAALLCAGGARVLDLEQGGGGAHVFLLLSLAALCALAAVLLGRNVSGRGRLALLLPIGAAFFLRALCLEYQSMDYITFLSEWAEFFRENGGFAALKLPVGNYNVPYLYFMAAISYLPVPDLYLIKLFSVLFDVLLAWGGARLAGLLCPEGSRAPQAAGCLLLVLPTVVLNGAYWGQCDAIYTAFVLHALVCALERRGALSAGLLAAAFSFKLQAIFLVPLWCALWFAGRVRFRDLWVFPGVCVLIALPALALGKPAGDIVSIYMGQMGVNGALSYNAPSVYQFIPFGAAVDMDSAALLGIAAAFALVLGLLAWLYCVRKELDDGCLAAAGAVLAVGVPFLLPYMHDRYFFMADALLLVLACVRPAEAAGAVLMELASLSAYVTYFRMLYTCPILLGRWGFGMGLEAAMTLCALALSFRGLARRLRLVQGKESGK